MLEYIAVIFNAIFNDRDQWTLKAGREAAGCECSTASPGWQSLHLGVSFSSAMRRAEPSPGSRSSYSSARLHVPKAVDVPLCAPIDLIELHCSH